MREADVYKRQEGLQPVQKTIIDRCVRLVYQDYLNDPRPENMPILEAVSYTHLWSNW